MRELFANSIILVSGSAGLICFKLFWLWSSRLMTNSSERWAINTSSSEMRFSRFFKMTSWQLKDSLSRRISISLSKASKVMILSVLLCLSRNCEMTPMISDSWSKTGCDSCFYIVRGSFQMNLRDCSLVISFSSLFWISLKICRSSWSEMKEPKLMTNWEAHEMMASLMSWSMFCFSSF